MTSLLWNNLLLFGSSSQIIYSHYLSLESESIESKDFVYPHSEEECHHADPCPKPKHAQTDAESVKKSCKGPGFCWICGFDCTWTTPRTNPWKCQVMFHWSVEVSGCKLLQGLSCSSESDAVSSRLFNYPVRISIGIGACTSIMAVYNAAKRAAGAMGTSWHLLKAGWKSWMPSVSSRPIEVIQFNG